MNGEYDNYRDNFHEHDYDCDCADENDDDIEGQSCQRAQGMGTCAKSASVFLPE